MLDNTNRINIMCSHLLHKRLNNYCTFGLPLKNAYVQKNWNGIFHPRANQIFTNADSYHEQFCHKNYPTVGIIFPYDEWVRGDTGYHSLLIEEIEEQDLNVIAIFTSWFGSDKLHVPDVDEAVKSYFYKNGLPIIDVLINCFKFSLTVRRPVDKEFLNKLGVPVLEGYNLSQSYKEWQTLIDNTTSMGVSYNMSMSKIEITNHNDFISYKNPSVDGITQNTSIANRIVQMARKARKWALLHREVNNDKKCTETLDKV